MQICVISNDEEVLDSLRDVIGTRFLKIAHGEVIPDADFYVWDLERPFHVPDSSAFRSGRHLFLVESGDLACLDNQLQPEFGCILLKPLNRATLEAFLGHNQETSVGPSDSGIAAKSLSSERDSLLQYVLSANLKLQEYDKDRTNFLARAVHDLRAPVTTLHGYCGLLLDGELGPIDPKQAELLLRMQTSCSRLATVAGNLLALTVEGHVQRTLELEQGDIEACIDQALEDLSANLDEKHIAIDAQVDPPYQPIFFERQQIEQVLLNLLHNASKFTPKRSMITIRGYSVFWDPEARELDDSAQTPNAYRIDIEDSGPGVDPAVADRIFEQYTSYAGSTDRSGAGLGLAICKLIVTAHGGKIWANPSKQCGSFSVVLPFEPHTLPRKRGPSQESVPPSGTFVVSA